MTQAQLSHFDQLPTRERMKPRNATQRVSDTSRDQKRYKKPSGRCEKMNHFINQ